MADGLILIADDDENDVLLFRRALDSAKILNSTYVVSNGEDVIHYLCGEGVYSNREKFPFPILLALNLQMPRRTGGEVLAWLQTQRELPPLKVLVISGFPEPKQVQQAHHLGAEHFLSKPPNAEELVKVLKKIKGLKMKSTRDGFRLELPLLLIDLCARTISSGGSIPHF